MDENTVTTTTETTETPAEQEVTQVTETTQNEETQSVEQVVESGSTTEEAVKEHLATKGVDFEQVASEYQKYGELSTDTLKILDDAGYPKALVDSYIASIEHQATAYTKALEEVVGGKESLDHLIDYVSTQGDDKVNLVQNVLQSGDVGVAQLVLKGLKAEMTETYGTQNKTILGADVSSSTGEAGFATQAEMIEAMSDARYGRDAKYTKAVEARVRQSNLF